MISGEHRLALPAGFQLGKYQLQAVLGAGGFGITYLAEDNSLGRRVAIKELLPNEIATRIDGSTVVAKTKGEEENLAWARDRFVKEGRALAACDHPNVVHVYEMIEANGTAYMVTKFEDGRSFSEWLKEVEGAPTEKELRGILLPLLSGLERVHQAGFLHRDIKPENIYLTDEGRPILLDFGSARQAVSDRTTSLTSIVTSGYAPFEQYHEDGKQGAWTDLYALAAVMYRAIEGRKPPEATRRLKDDPCLKLARQHAGKYSTPFLSSIDRALSVAPQKRPQSVGEWRQLLGAGPTEKGVIVPAPWWELWLEKGKEGVEWAKANPAWAAGAGVGLLVLLLVLSRCGSTKPVPPPGPDPSPAPMPTATAANGGPPVTTPPPFGIPQAADLNAMITNAKPGATIKIPPGMYPGGLVLSKAVRLVGVAGQVFIQSEGRECLSVRASGVAVENVQFICNGIGNLPALSVQAGGALELDGCKITSATDLGVVVVGKASLKAIGTSFTATNGTAMRLDQRARGNFTQCAFAQSLLGLVLGNGSSAELHSCAFDGNGGNEAKGGAVGLQNAETTFTADDCHFTNNNCGIGVVDQASLTINNSSFKGNGVNPRDGVNLGLIVLARGGRATLTNDTFESNRQGIAVEAGCGLEITKCVFRNNGMELKQFLNSSQPLSVYGQGALSTVRQSVFADSEQGAAYVYGGGKLILDDVEFSGTHRAALIVGNREVGPGQAEITRSHFLRNGLGLGMFAGSFVSVQDSEFRENQDGIIVLDQGSNLKGNKLTLAANRDSGITACSHASATLISSTLQGNAHGAVSGIRGKSAERGSLTLEDCRFGGNRTFAAGAYAQSQLTLTRCVFDGSDKQNVYKDRSATVQMDAIPPQAAASQGPEKPVPGPEKGDDSSLPSEQAEVTPAPGSTTSPSPRHEKSSPKSRRNPTPRPRSPNPDDLNRLLRQFLPGGR